MRLAIAAITVEYIGFIKSDHEIASRRSQ